MFDESEIARSLRILKGGLTSNQCKYWHHQVQTMDINTCKQPWWRLYQWNSVDGTNDELGLWQSWGWETSSNNWLRRKPVASTSRVLVWMQTCSCAAADGSPEDYQISISGIWFISNCRSIAAGGAAAAFAKCRKGLWKGERHGAGGMWCGLRGVNGGLWLVVDTLHVGWWFMVMYSCACSFALWNGCHQWKSVRVCNG